MVTRCAQAGRCKCTCNDCVAIRNGKPGTYEHCEIHMNHCHAECSA